MTTTSDPLRTRKKICVSAYACSPYQGSEAAVGWGFVTALARLHDLWVIVEEEKFRDDIERFIAEEGAPANITFHFIRKRRNRRLRKVWPPSYYWFYKKWHRQAFDLARRLHETVRFDLIHQLTMVGFREPGFLWELGVPFVWGPVGGMGVFPWRFLLSIGWYGGSYYLGYNLFNLAHMRFLNRPRRAAAAAGAGLIAATPDNQAGMLKYFGRPSTVITEVGLPPEVAAEPQVRPSETALRIVWSGQHDPGKALNLALRAVAGLGMHRPWHFEILGDGPSRKGWMRLAESLRIEARCTFRGWVSRKEALAVMKSCHVMLISSLRDLTSSVLLEALALGLPVVCLDHCGFASVVDESCGIKVPPTSPAAVVRGLSDALRQLEGDEERRHRLAEGALRRAQDFAWERKATVVDEIYHARLSAASEFRS